MNKENYKEIAKIINIQFNYIGTPAKQSPIKSIAIMLANYFEKEDLHQINNLEGKKLIDLFNKEQFLKECGVKNG